MNGTRYLLEHSSTERLIFRKFSAADYTDWFPFYLDPASTGFWEGIPDSPDRACRSQFDRIFERYDKGLGGMNALIEREQQVLVGMCGLLIQEVDGKSEMEIGYSLLPGFRGMGFATEAGIHCRDKAFANAWAESLISIIHIDNTPSINVALRLGMTLDTTTQYKGNPVHIFRVDKAHQSL
ncbi:GNAT family N-acetyltransferase [Robiginitalea aurantiaca]|uniref:GNAT family N-acetyltransferase n=1 Tax=Robiginitalea aurantiaca TaxID=3056915 RepID=A0ABT7WDH0_9FLAO|nr:GNAT family N-acetyltransferase [Robiginitalea aurantiaca]MDM9630965.1 GNAT family N-acetyltransferase [Robiginitalea aurantiaca]